jgi:hypothetical protein
MLARLMVSLTAAGASWSVATATCPLAIDVAFMPLATHVVVPVPETHEIVLPAAVSAEPALTLTDWTLDGL